MVILQAVAGVVSVVVSSATPVDSDPLRVDFAGAMFSQAPSESAEVTVPPRGAGPKSKFGEKDSWRWMLQGGAATDVQNSDNRFGLFGGGVTYFIIDDLSLNLELNGLYFDQNGNDAFGINLALLFRWHFFAHETWSIYFDGGAGLLETTANVPASSREDPGGGSSFNFTPQLGGGFTMAVNDETRFFAGARWYHVSNAQLFEDNPGRDHVYLYAGVSFSF